VTWDLVWREGKDGRPGAWTKVLKNPHTGHHARSNDRATWGTSETVLAHYQRAGFVPTDDDPFGFLDLDNAIDDAGDVKPWAQEIVDRFPTYWERSPRGKGLKGLIRGKPARNRVIPVGDGQVEVFGSGKYTTLTGHRLEGSSTTITDCQTALNALYAELCPEPASPRVAPPSAPLTFDDDEILRRARDAKNGGEFAALFDRGDVSLYANDDSRADLALCSMLAFWTQDPEQIGRLFGQSALTRSKWERRGDYRESTISKALHRSAFYTPALRAVAADIRVAPPTSQDGPSGADPCAPVRDELAELRRESAKLRRENTELRQRAETADHYQGLWMATARVLRNPKLRPGEKMAGLSLIVEVEDANRAGRTDADGWAEVPLERIAERAGCAAGTAGKHVDALASAGVIETDTKPIPGKRHARRVARFPTAPTPDGPAPTLADRFATLANAAPVRDDDGWGGDRRCRDHPHAGTTTSTTTVVTCDECGQILGKPKTRRRRTRAIVTQDARLSDDVETSETHDPDPIVNENDAPRTTTVIVHQDARLSPRVSDRPTPWSSRPLAAIVTHLDGLSPPPTPGGLRERVRTPRPEARP